MTMSWTQHTQGESSVHTSVDIAEPQYIGHGVSQHDRGFQAKIYLYIFMTEYEHVGL